MSGSRPVSKSVRFKAQLCAFILVGLFIDAIVLVFWVRPYIGIFVGMSDAMWADDTQPYVVSLVALAIWSIGWFSLYWIQASEPGFDSLPSKSRFKWWSIVNTILGVSLLVVFLYFG